jgi:hypothetical protein
VFENSESLQAITPEKPIAHIVKYDKEKKPSSKKKTFVTITYVDFVKRNFFLEVH